MMIEVNGMSAFKKRFDSIIGGKSRSSELMSSAEFLKV